MLKVVPTIYGLSVEGLGWEDPSNVVSVAVCPSLVLFNRGVSPRRVGSGVLKVSMFVPTQLSADTAGDSGGSVSRVRERIGEGENV